MGRWGWVFGVGPTDPRARARAGMPDGVGGWLVGLGWAAGCVMWGRLGGVLVCFYVCMPTMDWHEYVLRFISHRKIHQCFVVCLYVPVCVCACVCLCGCWCARVGPMRAAERDSSRGGRHANLLHFGGARIITVHMDHAILGVASSRFR